MRMFPLVVLFVSATTGCQAHREATTPGSRADADRVIALCAGGISESKKLELKGQYVKWTAGELTASFEEATRGIIMSDTTIASGDRVKITEAYLGCVKSQTGK